MKLLYGAFSFCFWGHVDNSYFLPQLSHSCLIVIELWKKTEVQSWERVLDQECQRLNFSSSSASSWLHDLGQYLWASIYPFINSEETVIAWLNSLLSTSFNTSFLIYHSWWYISWLKSQCSLRFNTEILETKRFSKSSHPYWWFQVPWQGNTERFFCGNLSRERVFCGNLPSHGKLMYFFVSLQWSEGRNHDF